MSSSEPSLTPSAGSEPRAPGPLPRSLLALSWGCRAAWANVGLRPFLATLASVVLALAGVATIARYFARDGAVDATVSIALGLGLPLATFNLVRRATCSENISLVLVPFGRIGCSRRALAIGVFLGTATLALVVALASLGVALAVAYRETPGFLADLVTSSRVAALGAGAYASLFLLGTSYFKRGRGMWLVLALDLLLGGGASAISAPFPRAHLTSLGGGEAVLGLSQRQSSAALAMVGLLALLWLVARARD